MSRSGHWTFFSSAQQETMKPTTRPRWRSSAACFSLLARRSRSLRFCSLAGLLFLLLAGPLGGAAIGAARLGRLGGVRGLELGLGSVGPHPHLDRRRPRRPRPTPAPGCRAGPADSLPAVLLSLALLLRLAGAPFGLALRARLRHLSGSPCGECGGRTSGRTCAARSGPGCCAWTCWSGSCGACSLRMQASPRCVPLREPFLLCGRRYRKTFRAQGAPEPGEE